MIEALLQLQRLPHCRDMCRSYCTFVGEGILEGESVSIGSISTTACCDMHAGFQFPVVYFSHLCLHVRSLLR